MQALPHTHSCFVCGESNPSGLRLRFYTDGKVVRAEFQPKVAHAGFQDTVHGGIIATVLDEIMVWACAVQTKQFGFCAEMTVRYQRPLRPGENALVTAELVANRRNRIFEAKAELRDASGAVLATATGKYLPIQASDRARLMADVVPEAGTYSLEEPG